MEKVTTAIYITVLLVVAIDIAVGRRLRTGDQPSEGTCREFKWGGTSGVHWYSCCNNCDHNQPNDCDGVTWQSASSGKYCGSCGVDLQIGNGTIRRDEFGCGGCDGQKTIATKCISWLNKRPGFCWAFSQCFHRRCVKRYGDQKRSADPDVSPDTCYNGVCDPGETPNNCPTDCCYKINPTCTWKSRCLPTCCGQQGCCQTSHGHNNLAREEFIFGISFVIMLVLKTIPVI